MSDSSGTGRQFKEVLVTPTNRQTPSTRSYDYYIVACGAELEIYRPVFPTHALSATPLAVLDLPKSRPGLTGTIDPTRPHAVNYLIIDFLGNKEVVLVACDDGDVLGYHMDDIHFLALQHGLTKQDFQPNVDYSIRPFFHKNVRLSAWGLSIHTEARMIAVSSNTHQITVFWPELQRSRRVLRKEKTIQLPNAGDNLPTVSFCNTGDDPHGEWLLSGSIENWMMVWNTRTGVLYKKAEIAYCKHRLPNVYCTCVGKTQYPHATWGTYWLDRRSFRKVRPMAFSEALGVRNPGFTAKDIPTDFWDISASRKEVVDSSERYNGAIYSAISQASVSPSDAMDLDEESEGDGDEAHTDAESYQSDEDEEDDDISSDAADHGSADTDADSTAGGAGNTTSTQQTVGPMHGHHHNELLDAIPQWYVPSRPLQKALDGSSPFLDIIPPNRSNVKELGFPPRTPILHISSKDIFIMQPLEWKPSSKGIPLHKKRGQQDEISEFGHKNYYPVIGAHDPLYQQIVSGVSPGFQNVNFSQFDRMNLHAFIPDIGVLCIGSGKGRVAICSLTQMDVPPTGAQRRQQDLNVDTKLQARYAGWESVKTVYCFRLDHILPFSHQEKRFERPETVLVGIAVGPIPGSGWERQPGHTPSSLHGNGCKRWRLILTWMDHSIMSYEIQRGGQAEGVEILSL